jgi:hypothetical protein
MKPDKELKMTQIPLEEIIRRQESVMKAHNSAKTAANRPRLEPMPKLSRSRAGKK